MACTLTCHVGCYSTCFSDYCFSMTCLKQLRILNVPLQESCLFPSSIKLWYSPLMFQLGWLDACLYHVMTTNSVALPLWSFSFWLVISLYALINNALSLCMIMAIIALLVGRFQFFASLHLYCVWALLVHPISKSQTCHLCPTYLPICGILLPLQSKFFMCYL